MARQTGSGDLFERVTFAQKGTSSDGGGGVLTAFSDRFSVRAQYIHLRGGESVIADRLEGRRTQVIRVRASNQTRPVDTDWRITDARKGTVFNVRDVTLSDDRLWIDFLVQTGAA